MKLFGTNVKMHQTVRDSIAYVDALAALRHAGDLAFFVVLPFTSLASIVDRAHQAGIWVGAQNMHWANHGEFTGEISAAMLRDIGVDLVLLGHAERRHVFNESDFDVRRKIEAALGNGLRVLLCVGETAEERRAGTGAHSVVRQLQTALNGLPDSSAVIIAYEPVWAIGIDGVAADSATIREAVESIRTISGALPVLYGGSVTAASAAAFAGVTGIDGLFVGRAARTAAGFAEVARAAYPNQVPSPVA